MRVLMFLVFMSRVFMLMAVVLPVVLMVMHMCITCMGMLMGMLMKMLMRVYMSVLMQMDFIPMLVFMAVHVCMFMGVQMLMFMLPFHGLTSPLKNRSFCASRVLATQIPIPYPLHLERRFAGKAA
jgi:hypothetical protein